MPVTVGVNNTSVVHKANSGITIASPDGCKVPAPTAGMVPIPYPNIAKTAAAKQKGGVPAARKGAVRLGSTMAHNAAKKVEAQQLRGKLATLTAKLQNLASTDPARWQAVLQDYAVTASGLYVTLNDDD